MRKLLIKNAAAVMPTQNAETVSLLIEDGKIVDIRSRDKNLQADETLDLSNATLYAGFIDVHNHGAVGVDVNTASVEDLRKAAQFLAENGVTAWLPTLVPDADENYRKSIDAIEELMRSQENEPIAQALGVHYEGVFANEKMCGALRPQYFKKFVKGDELANLPRLKNGVHLTTFAPEVEGGIELVRELSEQNWIPSIGHTKADAETLDKALEAGAKHVTHLFNAMTGVHHRDIGVAGWALTNDKISCEIIADGVHVHPEMLKFAARNKTPENLLLVSDAVAPTGLGDGDYKLWGEKISVVNGKTQNERGSIAGSVITMLDAVKRMLSLGFSETEVSKMASANPARLLGIEKTRGSIEIGKQADLVALDENGNVKLTVVGGKIAFDAREN